MKGWAPTAVAMGFASAIAQLTVIRQLLSSVSPNELVIGLSLGIWLAAVACGCYAAGHLPPKEPKRWLAISLILSSAAIPASIWISKTATGHLTEYGQEPGIFAAILAIIASCLPFCLLYGMQLNLLLSSIGDIRRGYYLDSIGDVAGGVAFTFLIVGRLDPFQAGLAAAAASLFGAFAADRKLLPIVIAALILHGAALHIFDPYSASTAIIYGGSPAKHLESPYGEIVVTQDGTVFHNGRPIHQDDDPERSQQTVLYPLMQSKGDERVLIMGGLGMERAELCLRHGASSVDMVQKDPMLADLSGKREGVSVIASDGRRHLRDSGPYDLIIVDMDAPDNALSNSYYTLEFFELAKSRLSKGGIFSISLAADANYMGHDMAALNSDIMATISAAFPNVLLVPAGSNIFLASEAPLDPGLSGLARARGIDEDHVNPALIEAQVLERMGKSVERLSGGAINRDLRPRAYLAYTRLWTGMVSGTGLGYLPLAIAAAFALLFFGLPAARSQVFCAGFVGTLTQTCIMLSYQAYHGHIYSSMGLLMASFMAGLVLGAKMEWRKSLLPAFALFNMAAAAAIILSAPASGAIAWLSEYVIFFCLSATAGWFTGSVFAKGSMGQKGGMAVGGLYGADLAGGFLGSIASAMLLMPFFGIPLSLVAGAAIMAAARLRL